uniref:Uncharacterized protein n=1 Tax=Equus asinus asinus TaxID=83772 RepID=A0A8C4MKY7_EQUAS
MTLPGVTQRRPELGALPNPAGQRGPSALAASGAPAGCAPGPRPAPGPRTLIFVLGTLLLVSRRRGSWLGKARLVAGREQGEGTRPGACPGHQRPGHVQADRTVGRVRRRAGSPARRRRPGPRGRRARAPPAGPWPGWPRRAVPGVNSRIVEGPGSSWKLPSKRRER